MAQDFPRRPSRPVNPYRNGHRALSLLSVSPVVWKQGP